MASEELRQEALSLLRDHDDGEPTYPWDVLIMYVDQITGHVASRSGAFAEHFDALLWADGVAKFYDEHHIPFAVYIDGQQHLYGGLIS